MAFKYAAKCKVLLVEDSTKLLPRLEQLLTAQGYPVTTATSRDEALALLMTERFHVAVIDVRLDDRDPYNYDVYQLMHDLRAFDPSTGIILLTIPDDLDIAREAIYAVSGELQPAFEISRTSASTYLEKKPEELGWLPAYVRKVFEEVVHINHGLQIVDPEQFIYTTARRMHLPYSPDAFQIQEELNELLRKLFAEWNAIEIHTVAEQNQGYSKAFVFQVTLPNCDDNCPLVIAKIGEHALIEREVRRYREHLERRAHGSRNPAALTAVRRTRNLGGMIYAFDGLRGDVRDFAQFFRITKDRPLIGDVMANLFMNTLALEHSGRRVVRENVDLRSVFGTVLRLDEQELQTKLDELIVIAKTVGKSSLAQKFWLQSDVPMINPVEYAQNGNFVGSYVETVIHGELHTHTVLLDDCNDSWLVDFANTGRGPVLQDYIAFEASLLIENNECPPGRVLYEWSRALFATPGELFPRLPNRLADYDGVAKTHHAVLTVRRLAYHELRSPGANRTYLIGLFFMTLRMMTVKFLTPPKRFYALTLAALIAENLIALEAAGV